MPATRPVERFNTELQSKEEEMIHAHHTKRHEMIGLFVSLRVMRVDNVTLFLLQLGIRYFYLKTAQKSAANAAERLLNPNYAPFSFYFPFSEFMSQTGGWRCFQISDDRKPGRTFDLSGEVFYFVTTLLTF